MRKRLRFLQPIYLGHEVVLRIMIYKIQDSEKSRKLLRMFTNKETAVFRRVKRTLSFPK